MAQQTMAATGIQSFDIRNSRRNSPRDTMIATVPQLPQGSNDSQSFGAVGGRPAAAVQDTQANKEPIKGFLTLIGFLVIVRALWELAEDAAD